jgi:UDP-glucose 4-epimerase
MKNVLVTGGAGFIGSHTVVELIDAGYKPVIVDDFRNSSRSVIKRLERLTSKKVVFYDQDYRNQKLLENVIKKENIDSVIHFAAYKIVAESIAEPLKYYENNVSGFVTLLEALLKNKVYNLVFSSSAAVYGDPPIVSVNEDLPCAPASPYGWSKYMDELILRDACSSEPKLMGTALRYFNAVGAHSSVQIGEFPKSKPQNLLPIIVQACTGQGSPLTIFGSDYPTPDGTCVRDYIHVVDLAKSHVAALQNSNSLKGGNYRVYNVGTGKPTSVMELIKTFERVNRVKVPYRLGARRPGDLVAFYASPAKIKKELGWEASKTVEDSVANAWHWQETMAKEIIRKESTAQ